MGVRPDVLDVVIPYSNPMRWLSREKLFLQCINRLMTQPHIRLTVVIQTHGNSGHDFTLPPGINVVRVHGRTLLWTKENLINIGVTRLPEDWKYLCWLDGDILFRDHNWAGEALHFLGHWPVIQPWQTCIDLGPRGEVIKVDNSFAYQWVHERHTCHKMGSMGYKLAHPGYAWCMQRWAYEQVGQLLEHCALGAADHHQALALIGKAGHSIKTGVHENYARPILQWERLAEKIGKRLYYSPCTIEHPWHGNKTGKLGRKYVERWQILIKHGFNPETDLKYNSQGVLEFSGNKPELERDVWNYHVQREEDANILVG
jgi:hypothetical protein